MAKSTVEKVEPTLEKVEKDSNEPEPTFTVGSSISRPLNPIRNSIYYEIDTGNRIRYTGTSWEIIDNLKA